MLKPSEVNAIPPETIRVAKAAFSKGNLYLRIRDEFGTLYSDEDFADLFPGRGQPALSPWRLALVTVVQFLENLSDRQAADAVRARIDLKYLLGLELTDAGFDFSVVSEFRHRLVEGKAEQILLDKMLTHFKEKGFVKAGGKQRTDSTHVLASIRVLNRLELVGETLRAALNALAKEAPEWLRNVVEPEWFERYGKRIEAYRFPKSETAKEQLGFQIGEDGFTLLAALAAETTPQDLSQLEAVDILQRVWQRHFVKENDEDGKSQKLRWSTSNELFDSPVRVESPYDTEARYSQKRGTKWVGYKVHLTETCEDNQVHVITDVLTTESVKQDVSCTQSIQHSLTRKGLKPKEHLLDTGYVDADLLSQSQAKGIHLIGPPRKDKSWQGKTQGAFDLSRFQINWQAQQVICPKGKQARTWTEHRNHLGQPCIRASYHHKDCVPCEARPNCTKDKKRIVQFHLQPQHEALQEARQFFETEEGERVYQRRAGIEGTLSQGIRLCDLRTSRYRGLAKTSLQQVATAGGINLSRVFSWLNHSPHAKTRTSHFAALKS